MCFDFVGVQTSRWTVLVCCRASQCGDTGYVFNSAVFRAPQQPGGGQTLQGAENDHKYVYKSEERNDVYKGKQTVV